jgi:hypothetical protein
LKKTLNVKSVNMPFTATKAILIGVLCMTALLCCPGSLMTLWYGRPITARDLEVEVTVAVFSSLLALNIISSYTPPIDEGTVLHIFLPNVIRAMMA